jgi:hypothetical protein
MPPLLIKISKDFATLFTTINPIATLALFAGLTASFSRADRFKRFPEMVVCGEGDLVKTFLRSGQVAAGEEVI